MHASAPVIAIWDDHEIANNPWMNGAEDHQAWEGDFHVRAGAAVRAFHEWLPTREPKAERRLFRRRFWRLRLRVQQVRSLRGRGVVSRLGNQAHRAHQP